MSLDPRELRNAFGLFATGVAVVTGVSETGEPVGLTVNSLTSVSLDPPMLLWCISDKSTNLSAFVAPALFNVNILAEGQADLAMHFARSARTKFEVEPDWRRKPEPPVISGALATFFCRGHAAYPAGDHVILLGAVERFEARRGEALVFHSGAFGGFRRNPTAARMLPDSGDGWF